MPIVLCVGGAYFVTTKSTLDRAPYFRNLVAQVDADEAPPVFVDRDPTHFRHILNHLRGGCVLPCDKASLHELRGEADFYSMNDLIQAIDAALPAALDPLESLAAQLLAAVRTLRR